MAKSEREYIEEAEFEDIEVAIRDSAAQRTPCVLVLDTSGSMRSEGRIDKLNAGLQSFERTVRGDDVLAQQLILMVIGFGSEVKLLLDWTQGDEFQAPVLQADGLTAMGQAMRLALQAVEELRSKLKAAGRSYTKPWIFLMSDGGPNDDGWDAAAAECRTACERKRIVVWPFGVVGADASALKAFARSDMQVYSLAGDTDFNAVFEWLATSLGAVSGSRPGGQIQIEAPPLVVIPT